MVGEFGSSAIVAADQFIYVDRTPPGPVTGLRVSGTTPTGINLAWTDPADSDFAGVMIRRAAGSTPPSSPTAGTLVADVGFGSTSFTDTGLTPGSTYSYALFAHDAVPNYAAAATATAAVPVCTPTVQHVSGTLSQDTTWSPECVTAYIIDGSLVVPSGVTLTLAPGTVVKALHAANGVDNNMSVLGTLDAVGTADAPVTFTSVNDNTVGGSTGTGAPQIGDWAGIYSNGGSVDLEHAVVSYARQMSGTGMGSLIAVNDTFSHSGQGSPALLVQASSATVSHDLFASDGSGPGVSAVAVDAPVLQVTDNTVTGLLGTGNPYVVDSSALDFGQLSTNTADSGMLEVAGSAATSTYSGSMPLALVGGTGYSGIFNEDLMLTVPSGVTLTLAPGTVVKALHAANGVDNNMSVLGTLDAVGTADAPVTFTSVNDNTVGGSTGTGAPQIGDWAGIYSNGGSVDLEHAVVSYARQMSGTGMGSLIAVNDTFSHSGQGSPALLVQASSATVSHDLFASDGSGPGVSAVAVDAPVLQVTDNTVTGLLGTGNPYVVDSSALDFGQLSTNTADSGMLEVAGSAATSTYSGSMPLALVGGTGYSGIFNEDLMLTVPSGVTLTLAPGTVVKALHAANGVDNNMSVLGTLDAVGTADAPVTFTSVNDNTVGGSTGTGAPQPGDWVGISVGSGGTGTLDGTDIKYASTALSVSGDGYAEFHGSVVTSAFGVAGGDSYVDATGVDWGSSSGPAPIGSGVGYSGAGVNVANWVGWTPPPVPVSTPPYQPPSTYVCKSVAFIGARGSGEDPQGDPEPDFGTDPSNGLGSRVGKGGMETGFTDELAKHGPYGASSDIKVLAVQYRALGVLSDPLRMLYSEDYMNSIYDGVNKTVQMIEDEETNCPSEKIVLAGYSQGALAIHIALRQLAASDPGALSSGRIVAVLLLADPAKVANDGGQIWENDPTQYANWQAGAGVRNADGIWTHWVPTDNGVLPAAVRAQALEYCHNHDTVCSPGLGASVTHHTSYTSSETGAMGTWAADQFLGITYDPLD